MTVIVNSDNSRSSDDEPSTSITIDEFLFKSHLMRNWVVEFFVHVIEREE